MLARRLGLPVFAIAVAAAAACGDDEAPVASSSSSSGSSSSGASSSSSGSTVDAGSDASDAGDGGPPVFGLDTRAANATCTAKPRPPLPGAIKLDTPFPNLPGTPKFTRPVLFLQAPGDSTRNFVVEQAYPDNSAKVKVFANDPAVATTSDFLSLPAGFVQFGSGEGGLLGLAFHPDWATNRTAFITYTLDPPGDDPFALRLARVKSNDNGLTLDAATIEPILTIGKKYVNHNGGHIAFGPDGNLYLGMGDGGSGNDPDDNAQNPASLLGKFLRITVGATGPYTVPDDNPFVGGGGAPEVFALGLRNPWRWSFDRGTGELWAGDVGEGHYEEIDLIENGANYGWRVREGAHCRPLGPATCSAAGLVDPIVEYDHALGVAVTGGYVYRGGAIPSLQGKYVFGDFSSGRIFTIDHAPGTGAASRRELLVLGPGLSSFGEDNDGELYVVIYNDTVKRIALADPPAADTFPKKLSETGCFEAADATKPVAAMVPFTPVSPLWSDGADKSRWLAIPDGQKIAVKADGDFDLPIGSVLAKEFRLGNTRVETRLFMRHQDGEWGGYSYEWNDAGTDADLLPAGKSKTVAGITWDYPDRAQCFSCHTEAAGRSLGLETIQLDTSITYPTTGRLANQLATLDHVGLLETLGTEVRALPRLVDPLVAGPDVATRARAYLHTNCSNCHRPGGPGLGPLDLRFDTAPGALGVCNTDPTTGNLGIADAKLLFPGAPAKSILSVRMRATSAKRMPPVASRLVHGPAADVIDAWITKTTSCP